MRVRGIVHEDFINYRKCSMFIQTISCDGKCWRELGYKKDLCHNHQLPDEPIIDFPDDKLIEEYMKNDLSKAIVFGGLEPFEQFEEIYNFLCLLQLEYGCMDDVVIYTGYDKKEIIHKLHELQSNFKNIIVKYGRYIPNDIEHYDTVLGVNLSSRNQYAEKLDMMEVDG